MLLTQPRPCSLVAGTVRRLAIPIHVPFTISRESLPEAQIALIELRDAAGRYGLGESAPFPSLTGDSIELAAAIALQLFEEIRGLTVLQALQRLRELRPEVVTQSITAYVGVEGALWDLHGREEAVSLAEKWGASGTRVISTDITLPIMAPAALAHFWQLYHLHGFQVIKVKVSGHVGQDLDMIQGLRALIPANVRLTLDGNQGFTFENALRLVQSLIDQGCQPLFFEQPLPEHDSAGQARLASQLPIPLCADETVRTLADAQRVIQQRLAHIINVKIMKSGIEESLAIIDLARRAQMPLMIGGMLESEVAMGISLQMACGTGAIKYADLDTPFFFTRRVTQASPWHHKGAELHLPAGFGHGMAAEMRG